jgi:hypothetical protein
MIPYPNFEYTKEGYVEAKNFLEGLDKYKEVADKSGYEVVHYANYLYFKEHEK